MSTLPTKDAPPVVMPSAPELIEAGETGSPTHANAPPPNCVPFAPASTVTVRYAKGEKLHPLPYPIEDE